MPLPSAFARWWAGVKATTARLRRQGWHLWERLRALRDTLALRCPAPSLAQSTAPLVSCAGPELFSAAQDNGSPRAPTFSDRTVAGQPFPMPDTGPTTPWLRQLAGWLLEVPRQ